jgi:hypothetical protein
MGANGEDLTMPRHLFTPSTSPAHQAPDRLLLFIQRAQLELVYERRRERRLPLHDSFRLTLGLRQDAPATPPTPSLGARRGSVLRPTVYHPDSDIKPAA